MKSIAVNFVVCYDLSFGERAAVDAEGMVFADRAMLERIDVKGGWRKRHRTFPMGFIVRVFVEGHIVCGLRVKVGYYVAVCRTGRYIYAMGDDIGEIAELGENEHAALVMCHEIYVQSRSAARRIGNPVEPPCFECFDEADDFYGELAA